MWTRKTKTVASVMESFRNTITDLQEIITDNIAVNDGLHAQRNVIDAKIEDVDLELHQARGVEERLNDLVFGPEPSTDCSGGCPK